MGGRPAIRRSICAQLPKIAGKQAAAWLNKDEQIKFKVSQE
jgi:hypothetical protein